MTFSITLLLEIYEEGRWTQKKTPLQVPIFSYTHDYTIKILNFQLFYSVKSHTSIEFCPPDFNSITEIWELSPRLSLSSARKPRKLRNSEFLGCFPLPHVEFFAGARREGNIWNILDPECCGHGTAIIWRVTWALQEFLFFFSKTGQMLPGLCGKSEIAAFHFEEMLQSFARRWQMESFIVKLF